MVWDQLSINKPHLVYIILGGFTSIFMLVSLFIKEKLYIGEATVATICGLIFGPHAANLIDPGSWGNVDQITLEFSRIVLVVQCFAVGVELPKAYMERHWLSVVLLLIPVMTFGWLITSLFIWWMIIPLTWLESLCVAACVTATDPVLASSVVGKGKFAKRVPKHIRDLLSAESGCNDGMAFPFIYLALNLIHYHLDAKHVVQHWFVNTILYECVWGAIYGVLVGYIARQAIKWAERKGIIDRESFLVFYFVLALFCAGSGSMLGMDDLLVGFAAGVGFSNDGWFTEKTEESHVSNVIDLLLNLTYFVYLGTIIPWDQFNASDYGLDAWRLVVIALLVLFFRRIPIMLMLKPIIPDIKTWREALFCGHFGPIGVGAIFVAILARAELETGSTTPLAVLPDKSDAEYVLIYTIWPITTFLVVTSIVVHGSSIAVFTLGRRINTLTMSLSYTTGNENASNWMDRLPRIASRSKSEGRSFDSEYSADEKEGLQNIPQLHLRQQKDDNKPYRPIRSRSKKRKQKKNYGGPISESAIAPQRNSEPALVQQESGSDTLNEKSERPSLDRTVSDQGATHARSHSADSARGRDRNARKGESSKDVSATTSDNDEPEIEVYEERGHLVIEDEEGNVLESVDTQGKSPEEKRAIVDKTKARLQHDHTGKYAKHKGQPHKMNEEHEIEEDVKDAVEHPEKHFRDTFKNWTGFGKAGDKTGDESKKAPERKRGPAHAYQIGRTIIVEDEDGEVIHKYDIPRDEHEGNRYNDYMRTRLQRMGTWVGIGGQSSVAGPVPVPDPVDQEKAEEEESSSTSSPDKEKQPEDLPPKTPAKEVPKKPVRRASVTDDKGLRMVISNTESYGMSGLIKPKPGDRPGPIGGGRRMSQQDFVRHLANLERGERQSVMDEAGIDGETQKEVHGQAARRAPKTKDRPATNRAGTMPLTKHRSPIEEESEQEAGDYFSTQLAPVPTTPPGARKRAKSDAPLPRPEAQRTQTLESVGTNDGEDADVPTYNVRSSIERHGKSGQTSADVRRQRYKSMAAPEQDRIAEEDESDNNDETAAERRRRLGALGIVNDSDSSDEERPRVINKAVPEPSKPVPSTPAREREKPAEPPRMRVQWGGETRQGEDVEAQEDPNKAASPGKRFKKFLNR